MRKLSILILLVFIIGLFNFPMMTMAADVVSVSEASASELGTVLTVEGYVVGVSYDGRGASKEVLLKDINNDTIIGVRGVPGTYPDFNYEKGDRVRFSATVTSDNNSHNPGRIHLVYSSSNDFASTVISKGNTVTYNLDNVTTLETTANLKNHFIVMPASDGDYTKFTAGSTVPYSYVKITGEYYINYSASNEIYRLHKVSTATEENDIKYNNRPINLRNTSMEKILGENWKDDFITENDETYPGLVTDVSFTALYTGANGSGYNLVILDDKWIERPVEKELTNGDIVKEIAYAYKNQGGQIEYDQKNSRRHISPSPEDSTAQHKIYLDCSTYVNAIYLEGFGETILPAELQKTPNTSNYNAYARDYGDNADVIGYWEPADYTTEEEKTALANEIMSNLQVGDILNYRHAAASAGTGTKGHVYVYVGDGTFLHCAGAGSYMVNTGNPALSYEDAASEAVNGQIQEINQETIFTDADNYRYIFKATTEDTVFSFCLLRPLARNFTPTEESVNRMEIPGLVMEKLSSVYENASVKPGDSITYSIELKNESVSTLQNVTITDTLPDGTEFFEGDEGVTVDGQTLTWEGDVTAKSTVKVNYTVKVTADTPGTLIQSNETYVNGVKLGKINHTVSGYSTADSLMLSNNALIYAENEREFARGLDMAKAIYKETLGIDVLDYENVNKALDDIIDTENLTCYKDTEISKIIVPNLYGGMDIRTGQYIIPDNDRARIVSEGELSVGDIILAEWSGGEVVYVYAGDSTLLTVENGKAKALTIGKNIYINPDNILISLIAYDRYAVLRPSMSSDEPTVKINSISIKNPPAKTIYYDQETFDNTGMVVVASLSNGEEMEIKNYTVTPSVITYPMDSVTVNFAECTCTLNISVEKDMRNVTVAEAFTLDSGAKVRVEGIFVGVSNNSISGTATQEMLIKDTASDKTIAVTNVPYGTFPDYGYTKGDKLSFVATVKESDNANMPGRKYLEFASDNGEIETTIVSGGNDAGYDLDNVITINTWNDMKNNFTVSKISPYTIYKFTGTTYFNYYASGDAFRPHNNSGASGLSHIKPDGSRTLSFNDNVMTANLGADWKSIFGVAESSGYPGMEVDETYYAMYIGADSLRFYFVILDKEWIYGENTEFKIADVKNNGALINIPKAGEYTVVFADYDGNKLVDVDTVDVTVGETEIGRVYVNMEKSFELSKGDKVFLLKDMKSIIPMCGEHIIE